ncbi:MAG: hypothetical protein RLZZ361_860, partial [Cyanobacteriota bacterium]
MTYISGVSGDFEFRSNRSITSNDIKPFEFKSQRSLINGKFSFKGNAEKFVFEKTSTDFLFKGGNNKFVFEKNPNSFSFLGNNNKFVFEKGSSEFVFNSIDDNEFVFIANPLQTAYGFNYDTSFHGAEDIIQKAIFRIRIRNLPSSLRAMPRYRNSDDFYFFGSSDLIMEAIKEELKLMSLGSDIQNEELIFSSGFESNSASLASLDMSYKSDVIFADDENPSKLVYVKNDKPVYKPVEKIYSVSELIIKNEIKKIFSRKQAIQERFNEPKSKNKIFDFPNLLDNNNSNSQPSPKISSNELVSSRSSPDQPP